MEAATRGRTVESHRREERRWGEPVRVPEAGRRPEGMASEIVAFVPPLELEERAEC